MSYKKLVSIFIFTQKILQDILGFNVFMSINLSIFITHLFPLHFRRSLPSHACEPTLMSFDMILNFEQVDRYIAY